MENQIFNEQIERLGYLDCDEIRPFVSKLTENHRKILLTKDEVIKSLNIIEIVLIRRFICGYDWCKKLYHLFGKLDDNILTIKNLNPDKTYDECFILFLSEQKELTIPSDREVNHAVKYNMIYNTNVLKYIRFILGTICDTSKESFVVKGYIHNINNNISIEHIAPKTASPEWYKEVDGYWDFIKTYKLNTLSNLTLSGYNSDMGNSSFSKKKEIYGNSSLLTNRFISQNFEKWNESSMDEYAEFLQEKINTIWKWNTTSSQKVTTSENHSSNEWFTPYTWKFEDYKKLVNVRIGNEDVSVSSWNGLLYTFLNFIKEKHFEKFHSIIDNINEFNVSGRPFISRNKAGSDRQVSLFDDLYIENGGVQQAIRFIKKISEYFGYAEDTCPVQFTVKDK